LRPLQKPSGPTTKRPRPRILYVEDELRNFDVAQANLEHDYELLHAATDVEACELLRSIGEPLAAILLDIQLQGSQLNGVHLCHLIRGHQVPMVDFAQGVPVLPRTPIFFMSAYRSRYTHEIRDAGATAFVAKPVEFTALSLALAREWPASGLLTSARTEPEGDAQASRPAARQRG
jgi:CheY-like chemotaxis protein